MQTQLLPKSFDLRVATDTGFPSLSFCLFSGGCGTLDFLPLAGVALLSSTWPSWRATPVWSADVACGKYHVALMGTLASCHRKACLRHMGRR